MDDATENLESARQAASDRLAEAWRRGHMPAAEHERRTTALRRAGSVGEVEAVERGEIGAGDASSPVSPIPPVEDASTTAVPRIGEPTGAPVSGPAGGGVAPTNLAGEPEHASEEGGGMMPSPVARAVMGVTPFIATALFFLTSNVMDHAWLWFLLIPIAWTVMPALSRGQVGRDRWERRERRREVKRRRHS